MTKANTTIAVYHSMWQICHLFRGSEMAEQKPSEGTMIECVGGGPVDGTLYGYREPEIEIYQNIGNAINVIVQTHIYTYNPTTNTYEYKVVRK